MPTAYTQEIIHQVLFDEVQIIMQTYDLPNVSKIAYYLQIGPGESDIIILTGFYEIKLNNDYTKHLYLPSDAIYHSTSDAVTIGAHYLKGYFKIEKLELRDLLAPNTDNLVLNPHKLISNSTIDILYYVNPNGNAFAKFLRNEYFPSPPAPGQ